MAEPNSRRLRKYIQYALAGAVIVLAILVVLLVGAYRTLQREHNFQIRSSWYSMLLARRAPLLISDAGVIRSWMTFDYVNRLFALPSSYLQTQLHITDPHYPRLTIDAYATATQADRAALTNEIESAIRAYPSPIHPTSTPTGTTGA